MDKVFREIYENGFWGDNNLYSYYRGSSGAGSSIDYNKNEYIPFLKKFIFENNIKTVVDLGCGDFVCGDLIYNNLDVSYIGYDTYNCVIDYNKKLYPKYNFIHLDFHKQITHIFGGDLCILKDVLQHWTLEQINFFMDYITEKKLFKYILIVNCGYQKEDNTDITCGSWRPLSCDYLPLKKYNPIHMLKYNTKECSLIICE